MRLSVAMIVKDEALRLGHALSSIKGLWDELVVVDTGSRDATPDIARDFGAKVSEFPWTGSFAEARHASLAQCTGDWILLLDADEAVDAIDHGLIREALEAQSVAGWRLIHRNYFRSGAFVGTHGPAQRNLTPYSEGQAFSHYTDARSLRLFRNVPGLTFEGRLHAMPDPWIERMGGKILETDAVIHHYGKVDEAREKAKARTYFEMALKDAQDRPDESQFHYDLLQQALLVEAWETVISAAETLQRLRPTSPFIVLFGAGLALQRLERHAEAQTYFERILEGQPRNAAVLAASAESLWRLGQVEAAQTRFGNALEAEPGYTLSYLKLSELFEAHGLWEDARLVLEAGLDQNPRDLRLWETLVGRSAARKDARLSRDAWNALQQVPDGGDGLWHQIIIHTLIAKNRREEALEVLRRGLHALPGHAELEALRQRMGA
jgi:tetratricopeptide (TPR) repeat protein